MSSASAILSLCRSASEDGEMVEGKWVYGFGGGEAEGDGGMGELLGGKGAGLAEMSRIGLPVPPGFTVTTAVCGYFYGHGGRCPAGLREQVEGALERVGELVGRRFGDAGRPLLVSVRSGARASMPGMMDTVLNLGLSDATVLGLARGSGDARFAYDSYRRFIQMYGSVVLGLEHHQFEEELERLKGERGVGGSGGSEGRGRGGGWGRCLGAGRTSGGPPIGGCRGSRRRGGRR